MLSQIVLGPQFQNVMSQCCTFTCRMASENLDFYPKMSQKSFLLKFVKVAPETKFVL